MTTYGIGQMAAEFGLTLRALRFYEQRGLIKPTRKGRERLYSDADRERIRRIVELTGLGFSLREIQAGQFDRERLQQQLEHMRRQRSDIDGAIAELERRIVA
ncbi:MAG: MerR family transcriptional regulator [Bosea sp.]|uniref:MerR family transcriptional regulator n=1 Tax=unclassified Bosea (in: a-proteobacteria) TaxID=2653178 RepID=UPI000968D7C2|nr:MULTISPECIES: MerR family transcriptional regulator [unclassified Bosea (in: a-proteobacteria)]MBN9459004.1 MerR family transcriptional regulator [Bosea sp. (in: a-proteobacteria)]OJV06252.1 MAG: hypothetical protein BGO20_08325 [Bosea sp. 67-29]